MAFEELTYDKEEVARIFLELRVFLEATRFLAIK